MEQNPYEPSRTVVERSTDQRPKHQLPTWVVVFGVAGFVFLITYAIVFLLLMI